MRFLCIKGNKHFTKDVFYETIGDIDYEVIDNDGDNHEIQFVDGSTWLACGDGSEFVVLSDVTSGVSDEFEEDEWKRLEKNTRVCTDESVESAVCDVAFAYQLSRIQSYIKECGADVELVVSKSYLAVVDEHCKEYRGNVEQILQFIKADGQMKKIAGEMDQRN